jgi:hypothetical protein
MMREGKVAADVSSGSVVTGTPIGKVNSPETYFGSDRNEYLVNGKQKVGGTQTLVVPKNIKLNTLALGGTWNFVPEYAENLSQQAIIVFRYAAQRVFFVASGPDDHALKNPSYIKVKVHRDGKSLTPDIAGEDVLFENGESYMKIDEERLYNVIRDVKDGRDHLLELIIEQPGVKAYTFTFG